MAYTMWHKLCGIIQMWWNLGARCGIHYVAYIMWHALCGIHYVAYTTLYSTVVGVF